MPFWRLYPFPIIVMPPLSSTPAPRLFPLFVVIDAVGSAIVVSSPALPPVVPCPRPPPLFPCAAVVWLSNATAPSRRRLACRRRAYMPDLHAASPPLYSRPTTPSHCPISHWSRLANASPSWHCQSPSLLNSPAVAGVFPMLRVGRPSSIGSTACHCCMDPDEYVFKPSRSSIL
ncbi:hypothetical protein E2562_032582 [Oryza meyeriana var. granulata]|uniref:Uncharacterized protein n=1 Tax=Oryza meyeriana var. granulata TaxID=110450 RepID=A0A6G1EC25_9ORYZ|nr:hypothetical protein E2562_032582 [Oryza meyeriana var. granulata]